MDNNWNDIILGLFVLLYGEKMNLYKIEDINKVKDDLLNGKIVAFGTDTVFGLACVYDDLSAIKKVYEAKNREAKKALPMMCHKEMIKDVAYVSDKAQRIMDKYMPGAITIVFKKKDVISDEVTQGKDTIAIRVPNDKFILDLIDLVGKPLLVTSANISGEPSLSKWKDVYDNLNSRIDAIVCKDALGNKASTIVDCSNDKISILREGVIPSSDIIELVKE